MKITITLPDKTTATADGTRWTSADPRLATYCTIATASGAASTPFDFLQAAKCLAVKLGAQIEIMNPKQTAESSTAH